MHHFCRFGNPGIFLCRAITLTVDMLMDDLDPDVKSEGQPSSNSTQALELCIFPAGLVMLGYFLAE